MRALVAHTAAVTRELNTAPFRIVVNSLVIPRRHSAAAAMEARWAAAADTEVALDTREVLDLTEITRVSVAAALTQDSETVKDRRDTAAAAVIRVMRAVAAGAVTDPVTPAVETEAEAAGVLIQKDNKDRFSLEIFHTKLPKTNWFKYFLKLAASSLFV